MAKRFTDTELWDKEWFMKLDPRLKCLVKLIRDKCDLAGVWSPNWVIAKAYINADVNESELLAIDDGQQFKKLKSGKILCVDFVPFQYGKLSEKSPVHRKIISLLDTHKIPYQYPINTPKEEEEEKEEDKEEEKEEDKDAQEFDRARKIYPGTKLGNLTEFSNFKKKHRDWKEVLPSLFDTISGQIERRKILEEQKEREPNLFIPEWKHFKTWINNRCWEEEASSIPQTASNKLTSRQTFEEDDIK